MSPGRWAAAPLAGAVIALAVPTATDAAPVLAPVPHPAARAQVHRSGHGPVAPDRDAAPVLAPVPHPAARAQVHRSGHGPVAPDRRRGRRAPLDGGPHHYHCPTRALLLYKGVRAILKNCRRGPEAIIKSTQDGSVLTFLDVNIPFNTSGSHQFRIVGFYRRHPALLVQNFDRRPRWFYFPPSRWHYH